MEENKTNIVSGSENHDINKGFEHNFFKNHPKALKAIIILAIILLAVLIALYFLNKKKSVPEINPTRAEVIQLMQNVEKNTKEQGLPSEKKQIDIMKYNSQE